ncbi:MULTISPECIES: S9 family peptidase [Alteromonas]|uniref:Acyl-peptide hydrolase n=1 Tax=Alteromonas stellipolaris TaxID=233316 RepID=A0ABN4LQM9_9ALTE|nr:MULTISPECIES: S9 family peptidase [Alteromonas]AMJ90610.1 acyl-peptide hydrolase [Alteromonas sp. Mac2]ALM91327.1 Acylamino-acid-releasing enzyme [Alteromonas stellipolaris LMG 21856]AMJ74317.1 acyl-peptide hydrolase [Alteromonas stellipolaris]AMJ86750.1 acyl-peptide hydrolase [Alteromonas sp. Mac1]ANB23150.1 acyl-peptide hydrolase [Alteromonas stellipolaris]
MNKRCLSKSALTLVISTLLTTHSVLADESASNTLSLKDVFNLEYAANPVVTPDGKHVVYERRSMDIMTDSMRRNLWTIALDGSAHLPILSDSKNHFNPVFSPDGAKMAYLSSKEGKVQVYLKDLASNSTTRVTDVAMRPSGMSFSPDGKYLAFAMFTPTKAKPLFNLDFKPKGAKWAETPQYIDQTNFQRDGVGMKRPGNMQIYVVPTIGGTPRQITSGEHDHAGTIAWSDNGQQIVISANTSDEADFDMLNSDLFSIDVKTSKVTKLTDMSGPERSPHLSPNGNKIAFVGNEDNGKSNQLSHLYVMNSDGTGIENLTSELDRSVGAIKWADNGKGVYFSYDDMGKKSVAYVSLSGKISTKTSDLGGTSLGRPYTSGDYDVTPKGSVVYTASMGDRPADLAIVTSKGKVKQLTDLNGDVFDHITVNKPELLELKSSVDNRDLQAWLVTPPNFDPKKKYPLILEIHGGPHTAYGPSYSTEIQLMAAAGYVVLYGNPRGSTSQGEEFANLIDKNYPSQDYDDLMDMVDAAIAKGYVDESNLFVTGGSGGGTLTSWIIGKTDRFKASVVAKPVINWTSMIGTSDIYAYMSKYWFTDLPWNDYEQYWNRSPLSLVGNVTTPTMVLTGELDVRTPMSESEQYYGALRLQGVDSALVRIQGAYHGIAAKPSNLARKVGYILAWFDKYKDDTNSEKKED